MPDLQRRLAELLHSVSEPGWRQRAKEFEAELRAERLQREERDALWRSYQQAWSDYKARGAQRAHDADGAVKELGELLDAMEEGLDSLSFKEAAESFQNRLGESRALFKAQRDELWARSQSLWARRKTRMSERASESEVARSQYSHELFSIDFSYDGAPILQSYSNQ